MKFIESGDGTRLFYQDWGAAHGLYITEAHRLAADLVEFINAR